MEKESQGILPYIVSVGKSLENTKYYFWYFQYIHFYLKKREAGIAKCLIVQFYTYSNSCQ